MSVDNKLEGRLIIPDGSINKTPPFNQLFGERTTRRDLLKGAALLFGGAAALKASATLAQSAEENTDPSIDIAGVQTSPLPESGQEEQPLTAKVIAEASPTPKPPEPTKTPEVVKYPEPIYNFGPETTETDKRLIKTGISAALDFFLKTFGVVTRYPIQVDVQSNFPFPLELADAYTNGIRIRTRGNWSDASEFERIRTVAHEGLHIGQDAVSDSSVGRIYGPVWLSEGSAELLAGYALADKQFITRQEWDSMKLSQAFNTQSGSLTELKPLEGSEDLIPSDYGFSAVAVKYLMERSGKGLQSLKDFYSNVRTLDWRVTFKTAFGMDLETFYKDFAAYAATLKKPAVTIYK